MRFYADDAGNFMDGPWHADRWRFEVAPDLSGPMCRIPGSTHEDIYLHELCLVSQSDGTIAPAVPIRFFTRNGLQLAMVHPVQLRQQQYVVDGSKHMEVAISDFHLPYPQFLERYEEYELPRPDRVAGGSHSELSFLSSLLKIGIPQGVIGANGVIHDWTHPSENPWRAKANGKKCLTVPIWLYCDDTSGNRSKRWNKHNSYLFTLAGLSTEVARQQYNIHFLSTSNLAPPLEMLESLTQQLK